AIGVATGIVQEFQFGMNWSSYSRFMGDIFGAPLAIEALLAFYMESTFLGVWVFGWDKLSPKVHAAVMWLVAIGSNVSAVWILAANSFMQHPVGYALRNGRAEMTDFWAIIGNSHLWYQWPHVFTAGMATAGFFVAGISAWHLARKRDEHGVFGRSFRWGAVYGLIGIILVIVVGHFQAQEMCRIQPMKMAAAEALWHTEDPASLSLASFGGPNGIDIRVPRLLSFLVYDSFSGKVRGISELQSQFVATYGPGDYVPPVAATYWSFRVMVGAGFLMLLLASLAVWGTRGGRTPVNRTLLRVMVWAIALPFVANSTGWLLTELGRQPWIVYGLQKTAAGVSPTVGAGSVAFSLVSFTLLYAVLIVIDVKLLSTYARKGVTAGDAGEPASGTA
ncbi:MAG: cytochrome ubiquinol oxidase subunit I, partial [Acidobacteria bacterium]|nr:cytochrome ubiquinol oxidase subunit I [Acidobacteriota bacterium]